ncbi:MAG: sigma-70 family RNA polymerase sigma factor, partial [Actinobacteria bacterium]|nr:sigma-70 family RNA polymerase sigma factor [Actinomycetota bacterium]
MSAEPIPPEDYRAQIAAVDRFLASAFKNKSLTPEDREDIRQDAFAGLELQRSRKPVEDTKAVLITCARNAARMRLRSHDHNRRDTFDPLDPDTVGIPDAAPAPDELAIRTDEDRRVRLLINQLGEREQAVLKLRLEQELPAKEIAGRLGLSVSRAHKLLKRAGQALVDAIAASELGEFSRRQRSLLAAIVMGIATDRQRRAGAEMLEDPHARAILAELRGLGQKTAAALPLPPAAAGAEHSGRLSEALTHVKAQLADATGVAKQHAAAVYVRAGDPTPLVGARPGAVAATVASCLALGAGAYCSVEGLPNQLGAPLGLQRPPTPEAKAKPKAPEPAKTPPVATTPPETAQPQA